MIEYTIESLRSVLDYADREKPIYLVKLFPVHDYGFVAFESSMDKEVWVPCTVSEKRYPLSDNYKITVVPMREGFGLKHFYQSDFVTMVKSGSVLVLNQNIPWQVQVLSSNSVAVLKKASTSLMKRMASWFKLPNLNR
jgi:hypothetical protein